MPSVDEKIGLCIRKHRLFQGCIVLAICMMSGLGWAQPPKHEPLAFTQGGFQSLNEKYLGNSPYFYMPSISPKYFEENVDKIWNAIDYNIDNITAESKKWWAPEFIADKANEELKNILRQGINQFFGDFELDDHISDIWGICVANADNLEDGPDNLFVFVDPTKEYLGYFDFGHSFDVSSYVSPGLDEIKNSLAKFEFNPTKIVVPSSGIFVFPFGELSSEERRLRDPRGICTDREGNFWVADRGNNRVLYLRYSPEEQRFVYQGALSGLDRPQDVTVVESANYSTSDVLCIANHGDNSLVFVDAFLDGAVDIAELGNDEKFVFAGVRGDLSVSVKNPMSIAAGSTDADAVYVAYDYDKIGVLRRDGDLSFYFDETIEWVADGLITSLKKDYDGNLFVLDNTNCLIGKYSPTNELVFTSGRFWSGTLENAGRIGFNSPKYLAIGRDYDNFFVTERWTGYNGIKKFSYVPRFMEHSAKFGLKCDLSPYDNNRLTSFEWELTKKGFVSFKLYERREANWVPVMSSDGMISCEQGHTKLEKYPFVDENGEALSGEGVYQCTFSAYREEGDYNSLSHTEIFKADLSPPRILHDYVGVMQEFFNPENEGKEWPVITFSVSRDALVQLELVGEGGVGGSHPITSGEITCLRNSSEDGNPDIVHKVKLDIDQPTALMPLQPYYVQASMIGFPDCGVSANDMMLYRAEGVPLRVYLDNVKPNQLYILFSCRTALRSQRAKYGHSIRISPGSTAFASVPQIRSVTTPESPTAT